ncbi:MAG: hypothetical protein IKO36_07845 [Bacteroidaceae bacterium]|nr:hypothetical protein [Bacteroidaceae bacterium]
MMKRKFLPMLTLLIASIFIFSSCSKDDEEPNFNMESIIGTVYMHYRPDPGPGTYYEYNYLYLYFTDNEVITFYKDKNTGEIKRSSTRNYTIKGNEIICTNDSKNVGTVSKASVVFIGYEYFPTSLKLGDLLGDPNTKTSK